MYGKNVFYWHIISNAALKSLATQVPLNIDELKGIGVLGENVIKEYGERLVKIINAYVAQNKLESYVSHRSCIRFGVDSAAKPPATKKKRSATAIVHGEEEDMYGTDIDFSAVVLPSEDLPKSEAKKQKKADAKSPYF